MAGNNDCLWREATRFDASRPQASAKMQVVMSVGFIVATKFLWPFIDRSMPKAWLKKISQNDRDTNAEMKADGLTPDDLRSLTCYDRPAIMGDIFQETVFKLLALKALVFQAGVNFHVANLFLAMVFGFFHMWNMVFQEKSREDALSQSIGAVVYFLITGYLYFYTNSIWPCIIVHIAFNRVGCFEETVSYDRWLKKHAK